MTTNPEVVNVVDTSTGTKPVTHTALVAVNKESTQVIPFYRAAAEASTNLLQSE